MNKGQINGQETLGFSGEGPPRICQRVDTRRERHEGCEAHFFSHSYLRHE
jgi:hypothetical protein